MSGAGLHARLSGRRGVLGLDAELEAPAGRVTALTGASGSGKTTLLRALAGLERLDGAVEVDGEPWQAPGHFLPPHRRGVGLVFQHAALLPHLSVAANLHYGWRRARRPRRDLDAAVALMRVEPLLDRSPGRLSGGERQRVAVARALASGPRLLLLDEPLSGVDAAAKAELLPDLREALAAQAAPVLYVSHDAAEVARIADRVLHLSEGRISERRAALTDAEVLASLPAQEVERLAAAALRAGLE